MKRIWRAGAGPLAVLQRSVAPNQSTLAVLRNSRVSGLVRAPVRPQTWVVADPLHWSKYNYCLGLRAFSTKNERDSKSGNEESAQVEPSKPSVATEPSENAGSKMAKPGSVVQHDPVAAKPVLTRRQQAVQAREELLRKSRTVLGRLMVRFKWLMIRQQRKFNADDLSAMFSWIIWGHILWIVLGTTTFISLLIWGLSKVNAENYLAKWVANLVTKETGLRVIFEEAIVPDWKQRAIVLQKVFVSRRPGVAKVKAKVGSQEDAAKEAEAAILDSGVAQSEQKEPEAQNQAQTDDTHVDNNYTQFDLTIDSVAVTLSVSRWLAGHGILKTVEVKGLRGIVDRRHIRWDPDYDPTQHKNKPKSGDFDFESFKMDDVMVQVYQPGVPQPIKCCIYSCELPQLRKQWLFYDFMNANSMSGSYDNSLFTLHQRQTSRPTSENSEDGFRRIQRLRVDGLDIKHLNRHDTGMFGWIESGTVDFLADIMLPSYNEELPFRDKVKDVFERWETTLVNGRARANEIVTSVEKEAKEREAHKLVLIDLRVQFNNTRASAPLYTRDLNYVNNALIHPVLAFINSRDTFIPVHCRVIKRVLDFDGSWTVYDSNLMNDVSAELYEACVRDIADDDARRRRIRKVGFWSMQFLAQLVLLTLGIVA